MLKKTKVEVIFPLKEVAEDVETFFDGFVSQQQTARENQKFRPDVGLISEG